MPSTPGSDDDLDPPTLLDALESAFGLRFGGESLSFRTVGDVFQAVRTRFPPSGTGGRTATVLAADILGAALSEPGAPRAPAPGTRMDRAAGRSPRRFLDRLHRASGLRLPGPDPGLQGHAGACAVVAGPVWTLASLVTAPGWWWTGLLAAAAGIVLVRRDPGRLPPDCRTLRGLAARAATLNLRRLEAAGAAIGDDELWETLLAVLVRYTDLPKTAIGPGTAILRPQSGQAAAT